MSNSARTVLSNAVDFKVKHPQYESDITDNGGILTVSHPSFKTEESDAMVIDNSSTTKYCATIDKSDVVWLTYQSSTSVLLNEYSITAANDSPERDPKSWILQGSNDGNVWFKLDEQVSQKFDVRFLKKKYSVETNKAYKYFRLSISQRFDNDATLFQISEWQLFGDEQQSVTVINTIINSERVIIHPNPASDILYIDFKGEGASTLFLIYDCLGNIVFKENSIPEKIDLSSFSSGIYFIRYNLDNQTTKTHKLIKK